MDAILIQYLIALYFIGATLPGMLVTPISRGVLAQFAFGLILLIMSMLHIGLVS